jgi:hypothetical protein
MIKPTAAWIVKLPGLSGKGKDSPPPEAMAQSFSHRWGKING